MTVLLHPVTSNLSRDRLTADYSLITCNDVPDALWHFQFAISKSARRQPGASAAPQFDVMTPLAEVVHDDPFYVLEIAGQVSRYEIEAADFLDAWIEAHADDSPITVVSRQSFIIPGGRTGDLVVTGNLNGTEWAGRVVCLKYGPRLLLLNFRCALADYNRLADDFFVSLMSFHMLDESPGIMAEPIRWITGTTPVPWRVGLPKSCEIVEQPGDSFFSEFHGNVMAPAETGLISVGKLTATLVAADHVRDARDAMEMVLEAIRDVGVDKPEFREEPSPYIESWSLVAPTHLPTGNGELRVRLLHHPNAWICAVIIGPARNDNLSAWMRNKRLLDVLAMTPQIG